MNFENCPTLHVLYGLVKTNCFPFSIRPLYSISVHWCRYTCLLATCRTGVNVFRTRATQQLPGSPGGAATASRQDQGRFDFAFAKSLDEVAAVIVSLSVIWAWTYTCISVLILWLFCLLQYDNFTSPDFSQAHRTGHRAWPYQDMWSCTGLPSQSNTILIYPILFIFLLVWYELNVFLLKLVDTLQIFNLVQERFGKLWKTHKQSHYTKWLRNQSKWGAQVAEATQRVLARYDDAMDRAVTHGLGPRSRIVPQVSCLSLSSFGSQESLCSTTSWLYLK